MSRMFFAGMPTEPDVKKLREHFSELPEGLEIPHEEIETCIAAKRDQSRYRTIVTAWRKSLLNQNNVELGSVAGVGYKVLTPGERLRHNYDGFQQGTRKQARSIRRVSIIPDDRLSLPERGKRDHIQRMGAMIVSQSAELAKTIDPPKPAAQISQLRAAQKE